MSIVTKAFTTSKYNHFYKIKGKYLGINLLSWAILSLDKEQYKLVNDFLSLKRAPQNEYEEAIFGLLLEKKFINPLGFNEDEYLKHLFNLNKQSKDSFSLGLAITLGCNFRCLYCYQDHPAKRMSRIVQRSVLAYLEKELPGKDSFAVSWWGGEPLLEARIIKNLGTEIMALCHKFGVKYSCSMSTNGYLLNDENIQILKDGYLEHIQVTIDGYKNTHDKTRILANGGGTYDVILENLHHLVWAMPEAHVTIRMNICKSALDVDGHKKLLADLAPIRDAIAIAPREVLPTENFDGLCLPQNKFDEYYNKIGDITNQLGFRIAFGVHGVGTTYCGATPDGNWLIHPEGFIHKCTALAHKPELALGRLLLDGTVELNKAAESWRNYSPFDDEQCNSCSFLPMCMGGCRRITYTNSPYVNRCRIKEELPLMVINKLQFEQKGGD